MDMFAGRHSICIERTFDMVFFFDYTFRVCVAYYVYVSFC